MRCFACGVEKDMAVKEIATVDFLMQDRPIEPLFVLCAQGRLPGHEGDWRHVVVCHSCLDALDADMWISDACWARLTPKVAWEKLPKHTEASCGTAVPGDFQDVVVPV